MVDGFGFLRMMSNIEKEIQLRYVILAELFEFYLKNPLNTSIYQLLTNPLLISLSLKKLDLKHLTTSAVSKM